MLGGFRVQQGATCFANPSLVSCYRAVYTGRLAISGIFLARCVGLNKKELKHEVYDKAYKVLTTQTLAVINDLRDPGADVVR
ncbi:hypothetical protein DPMN_157933 [Dreissena polymorpha]|uniref:Uncharacterized protein n=1 Tax=Dreissena polymorpha TaxID=45954 RepID=A0A9D4IQG5_DREPO|nr:hypothetical protein DPMN_157933 [Dreissena polymorpha]